MEAERKGSVSVRGSKPLGAELERNLGWDCGDMTLRAAGGKRNIVDLAKSGGGAPDRDITRSSTLPGRYWPLGWGNLINTSMPSEAPKLKRRAAWVQLRFQSGGSIAGLLPGQ